jgi:hypothetical protein
MSFLNLVMTKDFISIISDGQITTDGAITKSHFKKFEVSKNKFVVGITGFELITNNLRKNFYYQPELTFEQALEFLRNELEIYKNKQLHFGKFLQFNAVIAGFTTKNALTGLSVSKAYSFHIANQKIHEKSYENSAIISLIPDDIQFNPNQILSENLKKFPKESQLFQAQNLQRNMLYKVSEHSKTVNTTVFQEIIIRKND